jgi:hypothetical protein
VLQGAYRDEIGTFAAGDFASITSRSCTATNLRCYSPPKGALVFTLAYVSVLTGLRPGSRRRT